MFFFRYCFFRSFNKWICTCTFFIIFLWPIDNKNSFHLSTVRWKVWTMWKIIITQTQPTKQTKMQWHRASQSTKFISRVRVKAINQYHLFPYFTDPMTWNKTKSQTDSIPQGGIFLLRLSISIGSTFLSLSLL